MLRVERDHAYFLHQVPYRDNSAIVHLLTRENGKVSFLVRGLKAKKNPKRPFLQPCQALTIDYQLKNGLSKLEHIDFATVMAPHPTISEFMFYQYANELLLTVLPNHLPTPTLFDDYRQFLTLLAAYQTHSALRHIELSIIILFNGLPDISHTKDTHQTVKQDATYWFYPDRGLFTIRQNGIGIALDGAQIQAFQHITKGYLHEQSVQLNETLAQGAKHLATCLIDQLLNGKKLKTREIYHSLQAYI